MTQLALFELADCEPSQRDRRSPRGSPPRSGRLIAYHTTDGHALHPSAELCAEDRAWLCAALVNPYTEG